MRRLTFAEALTALHRDTKAGVFVMQGPRYIGRVPAEPDSFRRADRRKQPWREADSVTVNPFELRDERRVGNLAYLCAVYVRILRTGDPDQLRTIENTRVEFGLPEPSIIVEAAETVCLLWLLRDERDPQAPPRFGQSIEAYRDLQTAFQERLSSVGATLHDNDAVNVVPLPSKMTAWLATEWPVIAYSMRELFVEIGQKPSRKRLSRVSGSASSTRSTGNSKSILRRETMLRNRLWRIRRIGEMRQFTGKQRASALARLADCREGLRKTVEEIEAEAIRDNAELCRPKLKPEAVRKAIFGASGSRKMPDQRIMELLGVTKDEAQYVGWPIPSRYRQPKDFGRAAGLTGREADYRRFVDSKRRMPTHGEAVQMFGISKTTAKTDRRELRSRKWWPET